MMRHPQRVRSPSIVRPRARTTHPAGRLAAGRSTHLHDGFVVLDELVAEAIPPSAGDRFAGAHGERLSLRVVAGEVEHAAAQLGEVARPVQPAVTARLHEVERAAGPVATTGTPLAIASWMVWQKVSLSPGCTNTSNPAMARARSSPPRNPVKCASGSIRSRTGRSGPSPTMTSFTPGISAIAERSSTCFSGASRPT